MRHPRLGIDHLFCALTKQEKRIYRLGAQHVRSRPRQGCAVDCADSSARDDRRADGDIPPDSDLARILEQAAIRAGEANREIRQDDLLLQMLPPDQESPLFHWMRKEALDIDSPARPGRTQRSGGRPEPAAGRKHRSGNG